MILINEIKIIQGVTISKSLGLMKGLPRFLNKNGFDCKIVTSDGPHVENFISEENCEVKIINMEREVSLLQDLKSLIKLIRYMKCEKPKIVNSGTPKAGLLLMLAARITRVPIRVYTIRGLRLETTKGLKRRILLMTEKIAINCSTRTIAISDSLRDTVIDLNLAHPNKIEVIGNGSSNGIDLRRFEKNEYLDFKINELKKKHNIKETDFVLGFVGRITKDKGIDQLVQVFLKLFNEKKNIKLLIVGEYEENDPISDFSKNTIETHPNIIHTGYQSEPAPYYYLMQIFLFLTSREGFGNVSIEAALSGVPVIVKNVTGAKDTIVENVTGFIVKDSIESITEKVIKIYNNEPLRRELGCNGVKWAKENFSQDYVHHLLLEFYKAQLK